METGFPAATQRRPVLTNPVVALLLYLGAAGLGLEMALWQQFAPLIWPPAGLGLVLLLLGGRSHVPVIFLGAAMVRFLEAGSLPDALIFGVAYALAAYLTFFLLRRFFGFRSSLERIVDVSVLLGFGVLLVPVLSAVLTTTGIRLFTPEFCPDFVAMMSVRWLSDALGVLVVAPFLLVWYSRTRINWRNDQGLEVLVWLAILIFLGALVFRNWAPTDTLRYPMELVMFPIMAWAAIRFGQRGVSVGILLVSMMAVWELRDVIGPDATKTISQPPGYLWVFVGILSSTGLYLAATWTELRNREEELRTNEERLRAFVHALPDLALVFSGEGICTEIFAPLKSHFRERISSFRNEPLEAIYPADLARKFRETIHDVVQHRELAIVRYAISVDGEDRIYEGRFAPIEPLAGQPPAVMVVSYDLTDTQHTRQDLQKRDLLLKTLTEAESILLKEKIFQRGLRRAIECIGKGVALDMIQVYRLHGVADQAELMECTTEWMRENPYMMGPPEITEEDLDRISPLWKELLQGRDAWEMHFSEADETTREFLNKLAMRSLTLFGIVPTGGEFGLIAYGSTLERSGKDTHVSTILHSITESIRAYMETQLIQNQLEAAKEAAIAADHAKSEFLAIMSHEIRTPMNAILGFSDLLHQTTMTPQQAEYIEIIKRSGRDLLELINNILDFSKLESNSIELEHTRFNLETAIMEVMDMVLFRAKEKGIALDFEGSDAVKETFWGDPLRLRQILLNLLTNAVKFTNEGWVRLEVGTLEKEYPWYTLEFRVIDTGIGIPEENRSELFKAFRQIDSSTTREYGGTGLGLTIVQRLVDKMGGRVSLESAVGKGSTFSFVVRLEKDNHDRQEVLPLKTTESVPNTSLDKTFAAGNPLSILVVEDDLVNTRLVCEILDRLGYDVEAVTDGFKALAVLTEGRHNLVMMDMQMARLDGLETTRRIRKGDCGEAAKGISIAALTALALPEERDRILASGVDYYISKPLQLAALKQILTQAAARVAKA
jgi:signal transduction histidine kinase/integral membrane sensor domain MASE1/ActR/RegA family two-component response regulator